MVFARQRKNQVPPSRARVFEPACRTKRLRVSPALGGHASSDPGCVLSRPERVQSHHAMTLADLRNRLALALENTGHDMPPTFIVRTEGETRHRLGNPRPAHFPGTAPSPPTFAASG